MHRSAVVWRMGMGCMGLGDIVFDGWSVCCL